MNSAKKRPAEKVIEQSVNLKKKKLAPINQNGNFKKASKVSQRPTAVNKIPKNTKTPSRGNYTNKTNVNVEKTDWQKLKKDKKELKMKRKQSKDIYEVCVEAKKLYEQLKCRKTEKKCDLVEKLYNIISSGDTIKKMVMAHDTARIIQCMLKYAAPTLREQLSERLMPFVADMAISKYAHFCVLRMLKYGSTLVKTKLIDALLGTIVKLASHNISNKILDHIYLEVATNKQKSYMRQEFYGDLYKNAKDDSITTLADTYKNANNMKTSILNAVKANLEHLVNKKLIDNSLVHAVIFEYLQECEEDKMEETVTMFTSLIPLMLTTKEGSQAATICFYRATTKNRRAIVKAIKEHLLKICIHEHGYTFIIAVINALDDTKATKKAIYDNIHTHLGTLLTNQWGRRVLMWLISPADTNCFHPAFIAKVEEGLQFSKKDKNIRRQEIVEQIEEPLTLAITENPNLWISNKHIGLVTREILRKLKPLNFEKAAAALITVIADPSWQVTIMEESNNNHKAQDVEGIITEATKRKKIKKDLKKEESITTTKDSSGNTMEMQNVKGIEDAGMHVVLKKIIKQDAERSSDSTFGSLLIKELSEKALQMWLNINRACYILLNIVENNKNEVQNQLRVKLQPLLHVIKEQSFNGAKLLHKKLFEN